MSFRAATRDEDDALAVILYNAFLGVWGEDIQKQMSLIY